MVFIGVHLSCLQGMALHYGCPTLLRFKKVGEPGKNACVVRGRVLETNCVYRARTSQRRQVAERKHCDGDEQHSEKVYMPAKHQATPTLSSTIRPSNKRMVRSA